MPAAEPEEAAGDRSREARRILGLAGLALMALVAVVGIWAPWRRDDPATEQASATSESTTTSVLTADGPVAPLTGRTVPSDEAANLLRPALVAKIDAAAAAMPQVGLSEADVVVEVLVEGISRYAAVWHSRSPEELGPVRSARTSDPDLLALFGRPLFAYSGANRGTDRDLGQASFQDVSHDAVEAAYRRSPDRAAPHDLMADPAMLWGGADGDVTLPTPLFGYRGPGVPGPGEPVAGISLDVGTPSQFAWDENRRGWVKWAHGRPQFDETGLQLAPTNVVVLETDYVTSRADSSSPEAVSVGEGRAWLLSDGRMIEGSWSRPQASGTWELRGPDGAPLLLEPGTAWVALAPGPPSPLSGSEVADLPTS